MEAPLALPEAILSSTGSVPSGVFTELNGLVMEVVA